MLILGRLAGAVDSDDPDSVPPHRGPTGDAPPLNAVQCISGNYSFFEAYAPRKQH